MPIPLFNAQGLLPPGIHSATLEELVDRLGFSPKRQYMIEHGLKPVLEHLRTLGASTIHLNGSFATHRPSPRDIDGYVLTTVGSQLEQELMAHQEAWKAVYLVDLWPAYTDLEGEMSRAYWEDFFGHTAGQPPHAKGIVKLTLGR